MCEEERHFLKLNLKPLDYLCAIVQNMHVNKNVCAIHPSLTVDACG
jgi:hypothetical protein